VIRIFRGEDVGMRQLFSGGLKNSRPFYLIDSKTTAVILIEHLKKGDIEASV
jgi:hypothetical protein